MLIRLDKSKIVNVKNYKKLGFQYIMNWVVTIALVLITSFATKANTALTPAALEHYIKNTYSHLEFKHHELSYEVFKKAYKGYLNLQQAGKLNPSKNIITIIDFSLSSTQKRMWVIDLKQRKVLINDYVAHGQGSGMEYATSFSNIENSHQSSLGFYVTGEIYSGEHGASLRLHGLDNNYNTAAFDRAIVIHGADYVDANLIKSQNRMGRSWGCPAVSNQIVSKLITTINDGTCLFVFAQDKKYLASAYWLNKKIDRLPSNNHSDEFLLALTNKKNYRYVYDESAADIAPEGAQIVASSYWNQTKVVEFCLPYPNIWRAFP